MNEQKKINVRNKRATFDYEILEEYTAGIVLAGTEIKSIRAGKVSMVDTFCYFDKGELWVRGINIAEYAWGTCNNHAPRRDRKLLLTARLAGPRTDDRGAAPVPERPGIGQGRRRAGARPQVVRQARVPEGERREAGDGQGDEKLQTMIKAVFLDVDGTLVSFRTHEVPRSAVGALRAAHARGVRLFIATGRTAGDLEPLAGIPYDGVAALNGSCCVASDGRVVSRSLIPRADFERALRLSDELGFALALELDEGVFVNRMTPSVPELARMVAHPVPEVADLRALFDRGGCCQMCFYLDAETERRVMPELPSLAANRWCPIFTDINVRGVDKATGMLSFAREYGLRADELMAVGDGGNDVPMLRAAGAGVAMGNACGEAVSAADFVTASVDDDGIRKALEHFGVI